MSRQAHIPTEATKGQVDALAGLVGLPQTEISKFLGIDLKTLRKHYRKELDTATVKANAAVAKALFTKATKGEDTTAMIFWLKAKAKWTEKTEVSMEVKNTQPVLNLTLTVPPQAKPGG